MMLPRLRFPAWLALDGALVMRPRDATTAIRVRLSCGALVLAGLPLAGCILPGGQRVQPMPGVVGVVITSPNLPERGLVRKRVVTKQEPDHHVAEDGTACRVSNDRFREVQVGTDQLCSWQAEVVP